MSLSTYTRYLLPSMSNRSAATCWNGYSGIGAGMSGSLGYEGADPLH